MSIRIPPSLIIIVLVEKVLPIKTLLEQMFI